MVVRWAFVIVIHLDSEYMSNDYQTIQGCYDPSWHADGYCDDVNNNEACFFDGGDCCGSNVNTQYCTACLCLEGGTTLTCLINMHACLLGTFCNFKRERQNDLFPFEKQNVPNKPACTFIWHIRVIMFQKDAGRPYLLQHPTM